MKNRAVVEIYLPKKRTCRDVNNIQFRQYSYEKCPAKTYMK